MAKKFVRGITDVKTINNQDFDTNNVNDLLSDGQYNYIHRKKGKTEEYHNLTDNIKTISSDNTELLTVTNNNKTTNTATLHPKHDAQKEQLLESTRDTVTIHHGTNGTAEKTSVDTNPKKVLEHENLVSDSEYITLDHETDVNKTHIKTESLKQELQLLHQTKQDTLTAGEGITIEGQTISASGGAHDSQKEQVLESTRNTVTINHGTNGTAEKTTVDTNPQKVLEHENLLTIDGISKVTEGNVTTIGLKTIDNYGGDLDDLTDTCIVKPTTEAVNFPGGKGILTVVKIGDTVSQKYQSFSNKVYTRFARYFKGEWVWYPWSDGGSSTTIQYFSSTNFSAYIQSVNTSGGSLLTFSFECYNVAETVLTGELERYLNGYVKPNKSISNGAISITNNGTTMKLINSAASENVNQHATFTFNGQGMGS